MLCAIHYAYAEKPREVMYVGINVERPDAYIYLNFETLATFLWDEIERHTQEMMGMYPEGAEAVQQETKRKADLLSYYENQLNAS